MSDIKHSPAASAGEVSMAKRRFDAMVADFAETFARRRLAWYLAKDGVFSGLQWSVLGPLWLIIQPLLWMVAMIGLLRPTMVEKEPLYALYVAVGIVLYLGIQTLVSGGAQVFSKEKNHILNIPLPLSLFVLKMVFAVLIELMITAPIVIGTMIFFTPPLGPAMLLAIPGLVIFFAFGVGVTLTLGTFAARLVDLVQMSRSAMRILLFLTPVFWQPERMHGARHLFANFNPLYYMLLVVRDPLMGKVPEAWQYGVAVLCALVSLCIGVFVFARFRERIPVWI